MALPPQRSGADASGASQRSAPNVVAMTEALSFLAETFKNVGVSRAYGPAVTVDGEELIPVALVSFGFGGGGNSGGGTSGGNPVAGGANAGSAAGGSLQDSASGGGGGGFVLPLGVYCRGSNGLVVFRPNSIAVLAGLVPLVCAVGYSIRGTLRALRRR